MKCRSCSKQISFGLMAPTEIINTAELHVYERALYKVNSLHRCASPILLMIY